MARDARSLCRCIKSAHAPLASKPYLRLQLLTHSTPPSTPHLHPLPTRSNGYLDVAELARFFKDLFRDMPPYDLRLLVAHAFTADMEKDGLVRPDELLQHLRYTIAPAPTLPAITGAPTAVRDASCDTLIPCHR